MTYTGEGSFRDHQYASILGQALDEIEAIEANIIDALDGKDAISNEDALDTAISGLQTAANNLLAEKKRIISTVITELEVIDEAI